MKRNYKLFLEDISERIEKINSYIQDMNYEEFVQDDKTVSACIREIEVIGEATKQIPKEITDESDLKNPCGLFMYKSVTGVVTSGQVWEAQFDAIHGNPVLLCDFRTS
jgi:hypothetical protein